MIEIPTDLGEQEVISKIKGEDFNLAKEIVEQIKYMSLRATLHTEDGFSILKVLSDMSSQDFAELCEKDNDAAVKHAEKFTIEVLNS